DPLREDRLHLLSDRAGGRPRRHGGVPARVHGLRLTWDPHCLTRAGRLLEAPCARLDVRLRAAGVHHRRRDPADHSADRDHAAVRLLRRVERRRELRPARRAAARLEPREPRGAPVNKQISQVGVAALILIAALIIGTTYWQTWANAGL